MADSDNRFASLLDDDKEDSDSNVDDNVPSSKAIADAVSRTGKALEKKIKRSGIIYLSRIPPFMKPVKMRNVFSQFGEIGRVFLQPEDPMVRKQRKKTGGNGKKKFTEGWIEFSDKRVAKSVAESLNNTAIGGKKRGYYHDDIWNIKYLPKFKWTHISEKIAYKKASREHRMQAEISQARREANTYLENVDKGKALLAMENRRKRKLEKTESDTAIAVPDKKKNTDLVNENESTFISRKFRQRKVIQHGKESKGGKTKMESNQNKVKKSKVDTSLLNLVFGS